jgi:hypothetical protein
MLSVRHIASLAVAPLLALMLAGVAIAFTLLATVTLTNAFRLRRILLKWHGGQEFAGFFLLAVVAIWWTDLQDGELPAATWAAYGWVACTWMLSSALMSMRFVTGPSKRSASWKPSRLASW